MSCLRKGMVIASMPFGLHVIGSDVMMHPGESQAGTVAGAVIEVVADGVEYLVGPGALAAQGLNCEWCTEGRMPCEVILDGYPGQTPPETSSYEEYCGEVHPSTEVDAHMFLLGSPWAEHCSSGGGDPDVMMMEGGYGGGEDCRACGGASYCHDYWDTGPCHLECDDPAFALALRELTESGDLDAIVTLIVARQEKLRFIDEDGVILVASACEPDRLYAEFGRSSQVASSLRAALSERSGT